MASKTAIVKAAIARLGSEVPQALTEDVDELIAQDAIYDTLVEEFLCDHEWTFATRWEQIVKTVDTPPKPWLHVYALPAGRLNIRDVRDTECGSRVAYDLVEDELYSNQLGPLTLIYNWRPSEERWPADFAGAVQEELLARLLEAFEERGRAIDIHARADAKLSKARRRDRRQKPPFRADSAPLLRAWLNRATRRL